jgi:sulfite reductase alpha subunit-like flavoprotein
MPVPEEVDLQQVRRLKIIFASQTGTAEDVADRIARQAERKRFHVDVVDVADYEVVSDICPPD